MTNIRSFAIFTALPLLLIIGLAYLYVQKNGIGTPEPTRIMDEVTIETKTPRNSLLFSGERFTIEIARTPESQVRGLSGRGSLPEGTGMLFWFLKDGLYPFWMPEMRFSIDIVWIDKDWTVVHIEESVAPETYPMTFSSPTPARYVLELPAGTVAKIGGKIGQKISLDPENP